MNTPKLKIALICFHKNVLNYPASWIVAYRNSILNQTYKDFDIFEINYGGGVDKIFDNSIFENKQFNNHAEAHNYLLDKIFSLGYDYVANSNIDDVYSIHRIERQLPYMKNGYDVISSNFSNINEYGDVTLNLQMHDKNCVIEANANHNIICHPVVCYSKKFWTTCNRLIPSEIPIDDFNMWKRAYQKNAYKFIILPDYLLEYRIHQNKVSKK